jgi:hypothetical protein
MRVRNKELRARRHRKEQTIKEAVRTAKAGGPKPKEAKVAKPAAAKAAKPAAKPAAKKAKATEAPAETAE